MGWKDIVATVPETVDGGMYITFSSPGKTFEVDVFDLPDISNH